MGILHKFILGGEIFSLSVIGLIATSAVFGLINKRRGLYVPWNGAQQVAAQEAKAAKEGWPHRALVAFDIWFNVIDPSRATRRNYQHAFRASRSRRPDVGKVNE